MKYQATSTKHKILCLHGSQSSSALLKKEMEVWPPFVLEYMDLVFIDGPFPLPKKSEYDDNLFTWYYSMNDHRDTSFEQCIAYIEDCMAKLGPFDGVLGFSQGAWVTAALPGIQAQGLALGKVEKIKFVMVISGGKLGGHNIFVPPKLAETAFSSPIQIPSIHCFGETDLAKFDAMELLKSFVNPFVIHHSGGHEIPKLDEKGLKVMLSFLDKIKTTPHKIQSTL